MELCTWVKFLCRNLLVRVEDSGSAAKEGSSLI